MKLIHSDSQLKPMIENAIHKNIITRHEYQKIMALAGQDLNIEDHEKQLLCHLQGMMKNRSTGSLP